MSHPANTSSVSNSLEVRLLIARYRVPRPPPCLTLAERPSARPIRSSLIDRPHTAPLTAAAWAEGKAVRIAVAGEIDLANSPRLKAVVLAAIERPLRPTEVKVDLSKVTFIDASGVGALVAGREVARRCGVGFAVQNTQGVVLRVLDILGLTDALRLAAVER